MSTTMARLLLGRPRVGLGLGFALGLLVGVGMLVGSWMTFSWHSTEMQFPEIPLHAMATDRGENFSIATGPIAEGVEGIFCLDFLTGDLQCWVLNNRTNVVAARFGRNVVPDLGVDAARKNPQYLMVTGMTGLRAGGGAMQFAECVLYVADANSGAIVGYAVPWNRNLANRGSAQMGELLPIPIQQARGVQIRGQ